MKRAEIIPSMRVRVPDKGQVKGRACLIPYRTALFRDDTRLPETLGFTLGRVDEGAGLSAAIVGCSIGAEADSLLALYNRTGRKGKATVTGYDVSPMAVEAARRGLYRLYGHAFFERGEQSDRERISDEEKTLQEMGFVTSYEFNGRPGFRTATVIADAASVRRGHSVSFLEHDATRPLPARGEVDLASASNLLYHLDADEAVRIVRNMACLLADRGVLGLGTASSYYFRNETREPMETMLNDDFDLQPVNTAPQDLMLYARP